PRPSGASPGAASPSPNARRAPLLPWALRPCPPIGDGDVAPRPFRSPSIAVYLNHPLRHEEIEKAGDRHGRQGGRLVEQIENLLGPLVVEACVQGRLGLGE